MQHALLLSLLLLMVPVTAEWWCCWLCTCTRRQGIEPRPHYNLHHNQHHALGSSRSPVWKTVDGDKRVAHHHDISETSRIWKTVKGDDLVAKGEKIIGGTQVAPNSFPFLVFVAENLKVGNDYTAMCGGSLIDSQHVLSAAHCFPDTNATLYRVILGEHSMYEWESGELDMNITKITRHPKYDDDAYKYDVAILTLATSLTFDTKIKVIELNDEVTCPKPGDTCTVAGWGTMDNGEGSEVPMKVDVPIKSDDECKVKQTGVVFYGSGCGEAGYPGPYARVAYFLPWIKETIGMK
ncbi:hypothetical protein ACOMHN_059504 [Nucella lapillus]